MALSYLSLGSNLGDRRKNLTIALTHLDNNIGNILNKSGIYESEAWGYKSSNIFMNMVVAIDTSMEPEDLLGALKNIERIMGRGESAGAYADRQIDIDIIFYNSLVLSSPRLKIPHPLMADRRFVLEPLNEIAPDFIHPVLKLTVRELFSSSHSS